ncbi:MAG: uracil-xanthine permease family protein [Oscillospiraceae bacterium]|nr:uracil-xanthine permease family protein [Oscillospiraceae bacterium]
MKKTKSAENRIILGENGIEDATKLGVPRMVILGLQHTFAMFGATVLVPILTGLDVSTTLLMAGIGTLLFHLITRGKVPVFLGSSFAFLGGYGAVAPLMDGVPNVEKLPYACTGVLFAGLVYLLLSGLITLFGVKKIMRFFPPVVTGPIIVSIGLILAPNAIDNCQHNWLLAFIALAVIIACNIWGRGMVKILPILIGLAASYLVALCIGAVDFQPIHDAGWFGLALNPKAFANLNFGDPQVLSSIITIMPIALATMMEHIGDVAAVSATCGKNFLADPGLNKTLLGDGLATSLAAFLGAPANTTYGENTGVLALTKVYDPKVIRIAAVFAIVLSFFPKIGAAIQTIPAAIIGGISFVLYGMISAVGLRNMVDSKVDFTKSRNLIIAAVILVSALGFNAVGGITIAFSPEYSMTLSGLAIAALAGIILNAVLPGNDYEFDAFVSEESKGADPMTFKV